MQIISGIFKGKHLFSNNDITTRPLTNRLKVTLFDLISNHISSNLSQYSILDCFAGFGNFGLECLSRGSKNIFLIENNQETYKILLKNINLFPSCKSNLKLFYKNFFHLTQNDLNINPLTKNIIFLDPPYNNNLISKSINILFSLNLINNNTSLILKTENTFNLDFNKIPFIFKNYFQKQISSSTLHFLL